MTVAGSIRREVEGLRREVESRIMQTPTGEVRNLFCDINILLGEICERCDQIAKLAEALSTAMRIHLIKDRRQ